VSGEIDSRLGISSTDLEFAVMASRSLHLKKYKKQPKACDPWTLAHAL